MREIDIEQKIFREQEENQLKMIQKEEKEFYSSVASSLRFFIARELKMFDRNQNISKKLLQLESLLDIAHDNGEFDGRIEEQDISDHGFVFVDPDMKCRNSLMRSISGSVLALTKDREITREKWKKGNILYNIIEDRPTFFEKEEEEKVNLEDKENFSNAFQPIEPLEEKRYLLARRNSFLSPRPGQKTLSVINDRTDTTILIKRARDNSLHSGNTVGISNMNQHLKLVEDQNNKIIRKTNESFGA